jgi:hypothetical protein
MRLYISQPDGTVHLAADTGPHIDSIPARLYESKLLEVYFTRDGEIIRNATAAPDLLLARDVGTNKFDAGRINPATVFTETNDGTTYWWTANLDFSQPVYEKLLGVDVEAQKEAVSFECVADVSGSLQHAYLKLYQAGGGFRYALFYTSGSAEDAAAAAPSGSLGGAVISIAENATAVAVATALAAAVGSLGEYSASRVDDVVTFTAGTVGGRGWHSAGNTGFTMTLLVCGMSPMAVADEESALLLAQFTYDVGGATQSSPLFTLELQNTLRRPAIVSPGISPGRVRSGSVDIANGASSVSVTFAQQMPTANYNIAGYVKNTTDGSPLVLFVGTVTAQSSTGFTVKLNGETNSANYDLVYTATY